LAKGKVERAIGYVRQNFWPLRSFTDLVDVNLQTRRWLKEIANQSRHRETGQAPDGRFQPEALRPLPTMIPDYRDAAEVLVQRTCDSPSTAIATVFRHVTSDRSSP